MCRAGVGWQWGRSGVELWTWCISPRADVQEAVGYGKVWRSQDKSGEIHSEIISIEMVFELWERVSSSREFLLDLESINNHSGLAGLPIKHANMFYLFH